MNSLVCTGEGSTTSTPASPLVSALPELFAIVAAALTWVHLLAGQRIRFHCDNLPIVQAWTNQSSRHRGIMDLLRTLFFIAARNNFTVSLVHLPGRLNCIADTLSRNQMSCFFSLAPPRPTSCPRPYLRSWQGRLRHLLHRAVAPQHPPPTGQGSGSTTPSAPSSI